MNLETVFLLILTTARIVVPGIPSEYTGDDGKVYKSPLPAKFDLSMSLASSSSNKGKANVYLPEGVNSGEVVRMLQENLEPEAPTSDAIPEAAKIINYWGSGTAISDGQPLLGMTKGVTLELQALPKGSRAYWPDLSRRNPPEPKSAAGKYKLYTNYCGNAFFTIPPTQDFLPPVDLTDIPANPNLGQPIKLSWQPVPGAVAYFIIAQGGNANESITWSSSTTSDYPDGLDVQALNPAEMDAMIKRGVLMSDKQTACNIPAGVFNGSSTVIITMLALGRDRIENIGGIEVRILRRSLLSIPISPKKK
jgi:hypothetical protein